MPAERVADDERAAGAALHEQDGLAVPQPRGEEPRDLGVRIAARAHGDDVGAVDGGRELRRRHLDRGEALEEAVHLDAAALANVLQSRVVQVVKPHAVAGQAHAGDQRAAAQPRSDHRHRRSARWRRHRQTSR